MQTLKKKDIKSYKPKVKTKKVDLEEIELDEVEELDEFVNGTGAPISGDEKNVNNSEIKTAPQATTDDFNQKAIQPNRYLYNINSVGPRVMGVTAENKNRIAKEKAIALLEEFGSDSNNNAVLDTEELPDRTSALMMDLVKSVKANGLDKQPDKIEIILNFINSNLKPNAEQ